MARIRANNASGGGGGQPYYGTENIPTGSSYTPITLPFEPSSIIFFSSTDYAGIYTTDEDSNYQVYLTHDNQRYNLPRSRGAYYCEVKNISGTTLEVWNYAGYTLNYVAYP